MSVPADLIAHLAVQHGVTERHVRWSAPGDEVHRALHVVASPALGHEHPEPPDQPAVTHAAVTPVVNDYTGETTAILDGRRITLHDAQDTAEAGWNDGLGWWFGRNGKVWGDHIDWSGTAEQLLLWHLLDDGATLADPCDYCGDEGPTFQAQCIVCDGSGLADGSALAEELDRLYGRPTAPVGHPGPVQAPPRGGGVTFRLVEVDP